MIAVVLLVPGGATQALQPQSETSKQGNPLMKAILKTLKLPLQEPVKEPSKELQSPKTPELPFSGFFEAPSILNPETLNLKNLNAKTPNLRNTHKPLHPR